MREIVLDTETTGLDYKTGDRIIEIGCVELINHIPTGNNLQFYCSTDKKITNTPDLLVVTEVTLRCGLLLMVFLHAKVVGANYSWSQYHEYLHMNVTTSRYLYLCLLPPNQHFCKIPTFRSKLHFAQNALLGENITFQHSGAQNTSIFRYVYRWVAALAPKSEILT